MDKYVAQGAGFPADNEFLMLIQSMITDAAKLSHIGGDDYILYGCEEAGGTVSDGYMVLNGEVVRFEGGALGTKVVIEEAIEYATYLEDLAPVDGQGDSKPTYYTRTAKFGATGVYSINWSELSRVRPLIEAQTALVPVNGVIMYAGSIEDIPEGWALCNGSNGTPDLAGMFIVGYDENDPEYNAVGNSGGEKEITLTEAQMPSHSHTGSTNSAGSHSHTFQLREDDYGSGDGASLQKNSDGNDEGLRSMVTQTAGNHSHTMNLNNAGSNQAHENRPPFYTLAYIQYKGI